MRIAHHDFVPEQTRSGFFSSDYEPLESVVARANAWLQHNEARVVNIETVLLPNLGSEGGTSRSGIRTSGEVSSHWFQVIRVWYATEDSPDEPVRLNP